jgi:tryptophan synthase alpha chain
MNLLENNLASMKAAGEKALIPFLTAGDPDMKTTEALLTVLAENGADVIELGVPFSDPLADGTALQAASHRALQSGSTLSGIFAMTESFRRCFEIPVVLLVYYNMVMHRGVEHFCAAAEAAGVSALVVPDLPFEEAAELESEAERRGIVNIRFVSPTTTSARLKKICDSAAGFIYCVSTTGVTGERAELDTGIFSLTEEARRYTDLPLALGFGISTPVQAASAAKLVDAVIVGSALVQKINAASGLEEKCRAAGDFTRLLKTAVRGGAGYVR